MKLLEEKNAMTGYDTRDDLTTKQSKYSARQKSKRKKNMTEKIVTDVHCAMCSSWQKHVTAETSKKVKFSLKKNKKIKKNIQRTIF